MNNLIIEFNKDISRVFDLIERGEEIQAQFFFNTYVFEKYSSEMTPENSLYFAVELWVVLDEYLNNLGIRELKPDYKSNKDFLIDVYEDYQEDFKKIK